MAHIKQEYQLQQSDFKVHNLNHNITKAIHTRKFLNFYDQSRSRESSSVYTCFCCLIFPAQSVLYTFDCLSEVLVTVTPSTQVSSTHMLSGFQPRSHPDVTLQAFGSTLGIIYDLKQNEVTVGGELTLKIGEFH